MSPDDPRHGTYAGYQRKCRCEPCTAANASYLRKLRATNPKVYARDKKRNAARNRALWRLAELHPDEYQKLYLDEIGAPDRVMAP